MKYLLDTHTLIWFLENNPKLSATAKTIIEDLAVITSDQKFHLYQDKLALTW